MNIEDLSSQQLEVVSEVQSQNAKLLVLGGPGTGKTTTALWAARSFLENQAHRSSRVLFLTFSRSAVRQLVSGSPKVLSQYLDQIEITTYHSLGLRILRAFGRYAGLGPYLPPIQSESRQKLLGANPSQLTYARLVPGAMHILQKNQRIRELLAQRWDLVICDEVQDTSEDQWDFVQTLASKSVLLLGDPNQMIYTFVKGVSSKQFTRIKDWANRIIQLNLQSFRDPSGAIPALAEAIRLRRFNDEAVKNAVHEGQLEIRVKDDQEDMTVVLSAAIDDARRQGLGEIGVLLNRNADVREVSEHFNSIGVDHTIIGTPEAQSEALMSMATQCAFAAGLATRNDLRESLALFLTACDRGREPPKLANGLVGRESLPLAIEQAVSSLETQLREQGQHKMARVITLATHSWFGLRIAGGNRDWRRAAAEFRQLTTPIASHNVGQPSISRVIETVEQRQAQLLVDIESSEQSSLKLMTFPQTKGREFDAAILVFRDSDYFGWEQEPFRSTSRLLNVAVSRARHRVIVITPRSPKPLMRPLVEIYSSLREC